MKIIVVARWSLSREVEERPPRKMGWLARGYKHILTLAAS